MAERLEIYKCDVCGNIVEVLHGAGGTLKCCGAPMVLQKEKSEDQGNEKHVPVLTRTDSGVKVVVGSIAHPMEEHHFIEWIEVLADGKICRKYLNPNDAPEAEFEISGADVKAREYCTIHGLWKS